MSSATRIYRTRLMAAAVVAAALLPASQLVAADPLAAAQAATPVLPALTLVTATPAVTVERQQGQPGVDLDLGIHMVAERSPFEIRVTRQSYDHPITAKQLIRAGGRTRTRNLGPDIVQYTGAFSNFFNLAVTDAAGATVLETREHFCPNGPTVRVGPHAPDRSPYPTSCPGNPFTLGTVWGIQAGWATATRNPFRRFDTRHMPDGQYTARVSVAQNYRDAFALPDTTASVDITLLTVPPQPPTSQPAVQSGAAEPVPVGPAHVPQRHRPDLIPLPAWSIDIRGDNRFTPEIEPERLVFAATVWNAGPSPLVIEGFRRTDEAIMDTYQYFYDGDGDQVGFAPVGSMEWDGRERHHHWHFRDFAGYRLLDEDGREVVRSQKEAFCLANTDAINLFVRNAPWQPENTDLHSACGTENSLTIRQALAAGHGDSYPNSAPGRALTTTDLPNGTYYIEVAANPDHKLHETRTDNNVVLRQVIISGSPGSRTVHVPPYGLVDSDPTGALGADRPAAERMAAPSNSTSIRSMLAIDQSTANISQNRSGPPSTDPAGAGWHGALVGSAVSDSLGTYPDCRPRLGRFSSRPKDGSTFTEVSAIGSGKHEH